ncbi:MAG: KOW domain-containing RNA-binding protein [Clostridiales bacterium]|nr:KOW domain-containing RNA-binding protein [Clostridiales bacterium]
MMDRLTMIPGRVVLSTQGRDAGRYFIVLSVVDEQFVLMADGLTRKIAHPKKKKVKHLRPKPIVVNVDGSTLPNKHLQDSDLRKALSAYGLEISHASTPVDADKEED